MAIKATKKTHRKKVTRTKAHTDVHAKADPKNMQSFKVYRDAPPFMSFHITRQTVYWTVLLLIIFSIQIWILKVQLDIAALTDAILAQ